MRRYAIYLMVCMAVLCAGGYTVAAPDKGEPDDDNRTIIRPNPGRRRTEENVRKQIGVQDF